MLEEQGFYKKGTNGRENSDATVIWHANAMIPNHWYHQLLYEHLDFSNARESRWLVRYKKICSAISLTVYAYKILGSCNRTSRLDDVGKTHIHFGIVNEQSESLINILKTFLCLLRSPIINSIIFRSKETKWVHKNILAASYIILLFTVAQHQRNHKQFNHRI